MLSFALNGGFIPNLGQVVGFNGNSADEVMFYSHYDNLGIFITDKGISYVVYSTYGDSLFYYRVDYELVGSRITRENVEYQDPIDGYINFYIPNKSSGLTHIKSYRKVIIKDVYEGVDWIFKYDMFGNLHHEFVIKPGGNIASIKVRLRYADFDIENGDLIIRTPLGNIIDGNLVAYEGNRKLYAEYKSFGDYLSFRVEDCRFKDTLIIDPYVLFWATYYGGKIDDIGYDMAIDPYGNLIITGYTISLNFPTTPKDTLRYSQVERAGFYDAFILKFDNRGQRIWATYYGGSDSDYGISAAADLFGNVFILGYSYSEDLPLYDPGGGAYYQGGKAGGSDIFIAKFSENGEILWATYYGGSENECSSAYCSIDIDQFGNIVIAGYTNSPDIPVYDPGGAYFQDTLAGRTDAFILKFSNSGQLLWATYYGGSDYDYAYDVDVDLWGNVFITGKTYSNNLPIYDPGGGAYFQTCGTDGNCNGGFFDIFIVKFSISGEILWATYYGGRYGESAYSITTDGFGNVFITGQTFSPDLPLYNSGGYFQPDYRGISDAFILKFSNAGRRLWATYYGGTGYDIGYSIKVDFMGNIFVVGRTNSWDFPVQRSPSGYFQGTLKGANDMFISQFSYDNDLIWSSYYGGINQDCYPLHCSIVYDMLGNIFIAGATNSPDFPLEYPYLYPTIYFDGRCGDDAICDYSFDEVYHYDAFIIKFQNSEVSVDEGLKDFHGKARIKVYSLEGRLMMDLHGEIGEIKDKLRDLPKGVYILKLHYGHYTKTIKFIKLE